uniref:Kinesin-like protein n=1 Tax=Caenorhabditis japonica TaxID=281687 RepID=A0A8R1DJF4_CAEJA
MFRSSGTAKTRRRSSLLHPTASKLPRSSAHATTKSSAVQSRDRLAAPLPSSTMSSRATTIGIPGCTTLNRTAVNTPIRQSSIDPRRPVSNWSTGQPAKRTVPLSRPPRQPLTSAPKVFSSQPSRRTAPVPREPSEAERLKEKLAVMEKSYASLQEQLDTTREMNSMLKESVEAFKMKLERSAMELDLKENMLDVTKQQFELAKEEIDRKDTLIKDLTSQVEEKEVVLRKLHNEAVDLRGQIRVAVRVRPLLTCESESAKAIEFPAVNTITVVTGSKPSGQFKFEKVFTPVFSQKEVFINIEDFILSALHGYNVGLIAFGQTGSGKTHTMRGGDAEDEGVIPRAAGFLFRESKKLETTGWLFEFTLSFLEIYNNEAYDLLNKNSTVRVRLSNGSVALDGLSEHKLAKLTDMTGLLRQADNNRRTAATKCNEYSSRSHAIYMWNIRAHQESTGISTTSVLKLVDLAGSERAKESGVTGQQFNEMTAINQSLSVLQKCVNLQKSKSKHVPYRDSKLTQVLMDCLGAGNSKTMVIVNINPSEEQAMESKRSIEFACRMRETHIGSAMQQRDM